MYGMFNFIKNCECFSKVDVYSYWHCLRGPIITHSCQHLVLSVIIVLLLLKSHYSFNFYFFDDQWMILSIFSSAHMPMVCLTCGSIYSNFCPVFLNLIICLSFQSKALHQMFVYRYFFIVYGFNILCLYLFNYNINIRL